MAGGDEVASPVAREMGGHRDKLRIPPQREGEPCWGRCPAAQRELVVGGGTNWRGCVAAFLAECEADDAAVTSGEVMTDH